MSADSDPLRVSENRRVLDVSQRTASELQTSREQRRAGALAPYAGGEAKAMLLAAPRIAPGRRLRPNSAQAAIDKRTQRELTELVQRVFLPVGSQDAARSVLFATTAPVRRSVRIPSWRLNDGESDNVASATAEILARRTARTVCLVDADLQNPGLHLRFGTGNASGLSDILIGAKQLLQATVRLAPNLFLVPAGPRVGHLVASDEALRGVVGDLVATFDFVIFSGPPIAAQSLAFPLASSVDSVVLVVNAESTHMDAARSAVERLRASDVRVLGVVLSRPRRGTPPRVQSRAL